jgi:hypothetical protein
MSFLGRRVSDSGPYAGAARSEGGAWTADRVVGWLRAHPNLSVTAPEKGTIGSDLPATVVDVSVAREAENDDPDCPAKAKPCDLFVAAVDGADKAQLDARLPPQTG